jgi:hypothetical protein
MTLDQPPTRPFLIRLGTQRRSQFRLARAAAPTPSAATDWREHGAAVIRRVRADEPSVYLRVVASVLPKELNIKDETLAGMSDEDVFEALEAVRSAAGSGAPAGRLLEDESGRQPTG